MEEKIKEIVYQAVDYLGIGRVFPYLLAINDILTERKLDYKQCEI